MSARCAEARNLDPLSVERGIAGSIPRLSSYLYPAYVALAFFTQDARSGSSAACRHFHPHERSREAIRGRMCRRDEIATAQPVLERHGIPKSTSTRARCSLASN